MWFSGDRVNRRYCKWAVGVYVCMWACVFYRAWVSQKGHLLFQFALACSLSHAAESSHQGLSSKSLSLNGFSMAYLTSSSAGCHDSCSSCQGAGPQDCLSCADPSHLLKDGYCVADCGPGFYVSQGVCYGKQLYNCSRIIVQISDSTWVLLIQHSQFLLSRLPLAK